MAAAALDLDPSRSSEDGMDTACAGGDKEVEEGDGQWVTRAEKEAATQLLASGGTSMPCYAEMSVAFPSPECFI